MNAVSLFVEIFTEHQLVPSTVLGNGETVAGRADVVPVLVEWTSWCGVGSDIQLTGKRGNDKRMVLGAERMPLFGLYS